MADEKISAMAAATQCANADVLPLVQGGVNKKVSRQVLLLGAPAEDIDIQAGAGAALRLLDELGGVVLLIASTGDVSLQAPNGAVTVNYTATTGSDWNGAAPTKVGDAIDRCATLLKALNGGVGP